jgi:2,4-dienoyl-CoA reductase-like NADH-dependent reductase (Old Yellow Enzyme family)
MSATQPLLQPYRMGQLDLANRIVMAPLARSRATDPDLVCRPNYMWTIIPSVHRQV